MAAIDCGDFYDDPPVAVPARIKRANPDALLDRFAPFIYSMDLSPEAGDESAGNEYGAWSLWDLPITHAAQYVDANGNDVIVVSCVNRLYVLDFTAHRDEWAPGSYAPIYRALRIGPIPSSPEDVKMRGGFEVDTVKRFRAFSWGNRYASTAFAGTGRWRVTIAEWENEDATARTTVRRARQRMRVPMTLRARAFTVILEHAANEPFEVTHWKASYDETGRPWQETPRTQ